jgi:hypothetical protein
MKRTESDGRASISARGEACGDAAIRMRTIVGMQRSGNACDACHDASVGMTSGTPSCSF